LFILLPVQPVWFSGIAALIGLAGLMRRERAWFVLPLALFALLGAASQLLGPTDYGLANDLADALEAHHPPPLDRWQRAGWWLGTAVMAGLVMVGSRVMLRQAGASLAAWGVVIGLLVGLGIGLAQALADPAGGRVTGLTPNPNFYGIGATLSAALAAVLGGGLPGAVALLLGMGAATMSGSRAAWLGLVVTSLLVLARFPPRARYLGLLGAAGAFLLASVWFPEQLRLATLIDPDYVTNQSRLEVWAVAWQAVTAHPLTGLGVGGFQSYYQVHQPPAALDPYASHAHNLLLGLLVESGVLGLAGFLVLWGQVWRYLWRARAWLVLGLIGVAVLINLVDYIWFAAAVHYPLWVAVAWASIAGEPPRLANCQACGSEQ